MLIISAKILLVHKKIGIIIIKKKTFPYKVYISLWISLPFFWYFSFYIYCSSNYCYSDSCRSFLLLIKDDNYKGSTTETKTWTNVLNKNKKWSKEIKSNNFCFCKVEWAITIWRAIVKKEQKVFLYFGWTYIIFAHGTYLHT